MHPDYFSELIISVSDHLISVLIVMTEENQNIQTQKEKNLHNENTEQVHGQKKQPQSIENELDNEEREQDLRSRQHRSGGRGKPPRRVIEEGANDPYCE
jgi:hypothetical protein